MITAIELVYLCIATAVVGYIFSGFVKISSREEEFTSWLASRFNWEDFRFACAIAAPAVVLHELAHKFVAIGFGLSAEFSIWPFGLALGVVLKVIGSGFILVAPGYVNIIGTASQSQIALVAFAGPFTNLILWLGVWSWLKKAKKLGRKQGLFLFLTKEINKWLFIFNMLPIPPLDGSRILFYLISLI